MARIDRPTADRLRDNQKAAAIVGHMFRWPSPIETAEVTSNSRMSADDSALRECDESGGTRYSERHSAQKEPSCGSTIATHSGQARPSADQSISMPAALMLRASVDFQPPAPSNGT